MVMVFKSALLINLLFVSLSLLAVLPLLEARLVRRRESRQSRPNELESVDAPAGSVSHVKYSHNWAGAVWSNKSDGTFSTVAGTFTAPTLSGPDGSASAWVGIDGESCTNAILQTGIDFTITKGQVSYDAWYEWWPDHAYYFNGIQISAGDQIKTTVVSSSTTSGVAIIENLTTRKIVTQALTSTHALCGQDAEWIIEDYEKANGLVTLANFGKVTFTGATASGPTNDVPYTPYGALILDIKQNNTIFTSTSTGSRDTVTVAYSVSY